MHSYQAPPWLVGGNAQTIWPALFAKRYHGSAPVFRRERWSTPDGDFIDVDWQMSAPDGGVPPPPPEGVRAGLGVAGAVCQALPRQPAGVHS